MGRIMNVNAPTDESNGLATKSKAHVGLHVVPWIGSWIRSNLRIQFNKEGYRLCTNYFESSVKHGVAKEGPVRH